jgi:anthranilate phosphoribosyltransferase
LSLHGDLGPLLHRISGAITGGRIHNLSTEGAHNLFEMMLAGQGTDAQVSMALAAMRVKGATADELVGAAKAARSRIQFPQLPDRCVVVATSRQGKRKSPPMLLAAAAAASAAGVPVLLQTAPSRIDGGVTPGDLWLRLIGSLLGDAPHTEEMLHEFGLACWRPTLADSGWQRLQRIEDETGIRGIPDVVTKLMLPEGARIVTAAVPGPVLGLAGDAFQSLGHNHALIVQGVEGSVDPSVVESTRGMRLVNGIKAPLRIRPSDFAFFESCEPQHQHEDPVEAAVVATHQALLGSAGCETCSACLTAALLISVVESNLDLATCLSMAIEAMESGAADAKLRALRA